MNISTTIVSLTAIGAMVGAPSWPHGGFGYGWYPSGGAGLIVLILILLLVFR